jgi:hypothetical protein
MILQRSNRTMKGKKKEKRKQANGMKGITIIYTEIVLKCKLEFGSSSRQECLSST